MSIGKLVTRCRNLAAIFAVLVTLLVAGPAFAGEPTDFIKSHSEEVTTLLGQPESEERADKFSKLANELIDFRELASRALDEHWKKRSDDEREEFLTLLQNLLEANYKKKLEGQEVGEDYQIEYTEEKQRGDRALVRTIVKWGESDKERKPVEYKMMKGEKGWVIYDLVIDDISLEETYRESYTKIIEKDGWDTLIEKMKEKIAELKNADGEEKGG